MADRNEPEVTLEEREKVEALTKIGQSVAHGIGLSLQINGMCDCVNCRIETAWAALVFSFNGAEMDTVELNTRMLGRRLWDFRKYARQAAAFHDACEETGIDPNSAHHA